MKTAEIEKVEKPKHLTRGLRVEVIKPLGASWDDVGPLLRTQRSIMHRLYTASALAAIEADRKSRRGLVTASPQTVAYWAVDGAPNSPDAATRRLSMDYAELPGIREWAKKKARTARGSDKARFDLLADLHLPGCMGASISSVAWSHVKKWKKDKNKTRAPTWKHGSPIPCPAKESGLRMDGKTAVLTVKLTPKGSHDFVVRAGNGAHWGRLRALATEQEGLKRGDVKLSYDVRQKKWFAVIAYSEPKPLPPARLDPGHVMVLHRGQRNLLVAMTNRRATWNVIAKGDKLREFKRRMRKRREQSQGVTLGERGSGARGHGRKRRYAVPEALAKKEADYIHTMCQQIGARVAVLASEWGVGTVLIEDYKGIEPDDERGKRMYMERFPNHELHQCIEWALAKIGVKLGTYSHEYVSQECPACGAVNPKNHSLRTGVFTCTSCDFGKRSSDWVACLNALRRVSDDGNAGAIEGSIRMLRSIVDKICEPCTGPGKEDD